MIQFLRKRNLGLRTFDDYTVLGLVGQGRLSFDEPLENYFTETYASLHRRWAWGKYRSAAIEKNLRKIAENEGWRWDPPLKTKRLAEAFLRIPIIKGYPVNAAFFPSHVASKSMRAGIGKVDELCLRALEDEELVSQRGRPGDARSNRLFGGKSKKAIGEFLDAILASDVEHIRRIIPMRLDGRSVDFGLLVERALTGRVGLGAMHDRLVARRTLEEVARKVGVNRERVRQVQDGLLNRFRAVIDSMPDLRSALLAQWRKDGRVAVDTERGRESGQVASAAITELLGFKVVPKPAGPLFPDEVDADEPHVEGAVSRVAVNRYERDPAAREECIEHYGATCQVCSFDFGERFGEIGHGFIHVHHLVPLSSIKKGYVIDPVKDLRPLCPNCHAMLHRRTPPFTIDELKTKRQQATRPCRHVAFRRQMEDEG